MSLAYSLADHYRDVSAVYRELGQLDAELYCIGNQDFTGWYRAKPAGGSWDGKARPFALAAEYPELRDGLDRVLYATFGYVPREWYTDAWDRYRWNEPDGPDDNPSREWAGGESPTPDYGDLRAYAPFADIDLADDVKGGRPDGDIPQDMIEEALGLYLDAFADLAGARRHVFALDSVGGAYAFVAPTSTLPIGEAFGADDRELIFSELVSRLNEWLDDVRAEINDAVPGVEGVFEPDLLNNKNRLYKAPLSAHSSLDGVVTPVDPERPRYDYTPVGAVDGDLIASGEEWAERFTADHTDAVASIVATLWPDYADDADTWRDALAGWLDAKREEQREKERVRTRRQERRERRGTGLGDLKTTTNLDDVLDAIDRIDPEEVVSDLCDEWDTANRDPPRFAPGYRSSDSGTSCFVNEEGKIVDLDDKQKAIGVVHYVARESLNISVGPNDTASGKDWWQAVDELRDMGYSIPRLVDEKKADMSPYYFYNLDRVATRHDVDGDPFDDRQALLSACLYAREANSELAGEKPPYAALVAVAEHTGLVFEDPDQNILGETSYNVAKRVFADLEPGDV